ncbi:replication stress response regulator SDE2-like [Pollicipes pollicipes]|uniref:replication stress response regulator SDE2-like n=1 Tax=Pollicipes pollicipes TaxID=41117 RepID=UPI0018850510|nr:replication stress response regulator SDE2-like [Pollicipes pollicipes]
MRAVDPASVKTESTREKPLRLATIGEKAGVGKRLALLRYISVVALLSPHKSLSSIGCLPGGKGGFGSMLRAIGAQIEKTTNREACRDLSGRRLRDINEEKRLKTWIDKQAERQKESDDKKKARLEKLRQKPKHVFEDKEYMDQKEKQQDNLFDAIEAGTSTEKCQDGSLEHGLKRSADDSEEPSATKRGKKDVNPVPKKKKQLWIDPDLPDDSDLSGSESDGDSNEKSALTTA